MLGKLVLNKSSFKKFFSTIPSWATIDPWKVSPTNQYSVENLIDGQWTTTNSYDEVIDPLNGGNFLRVPNTNEQEAQDFINSSLRTSKAGLHNIFKNPHRFQLYGDICFRISQGMRDPDILKFFWALNQRVMPKSDLQSEAEVVVTRKFFDNMSGDYPRILQRGFVQAGDHYGQVSSGYRFPYGSVAVIAPFNFPLEIPALQVFGALICGNRVTLKCDSKMAVQMEQFIRFAIHCGMPAEDINLINCRNEIMEMLINQSNFRNIQFTGSSGVADHLAVVSKGKVRIEDAGPDVSEFDFVTYQSDQDAYAASGQKCSAQSICFVHENWARAGYYERCKQLASTRRVDNLTIGPVITWNNQQIKAHIDSMLQIPGARILWGGNPLTGHNIPDCYGSYEPTAVFVPIEQFFNKQYFDLITTELFGPFQVVIEYRSEQVDQLLVSLADIKHHLTAAIVSNDNQFINKMLADTLNGTTYSGIRARTTGAPQNHWFGPSGDPRGAGIGSPEALLHVWTTHREVVTDIGPVQEGFNYIQS